MRTGLRYGWVWILMLSVIINACDTPGNVDPVFKNYFIKYYGGDGNQEGSDMLVNADGTVVLLGTWTANSGRKRVYLIKTDNEGNVLWDKKMGGVNDEQAADVELITNGPDAGNIAVLSNYRKNTLDSMAIRLTIISQSGDSVKSVLINHYGSQLARSITPLLDGGYYIAAKTTDPANTGNPTDPTEDNVLFIRLLNDFSFHSTFGITEFAGFYIGSAIKIYEESPTQYLLSGYSDRNEGANPGGTSNFFFQVLTHTGSGDSRTTTYSGTDDNDEIMSGIVKSPSGQFMAIGTSTVGSSGVMIATRISSNFSSVSSIQTFPNAEGVAIASSDASNFLLLGNAYGTGGNRDILIKKVDIAFGELMTLRFGSTNNDDTGSAINELPNGDILVLGTMELVNQKKMALIKVRPNGKFE